MANKSSIEGAAEEIRKFSNQHGLSERENEILYLLVFKFCHGELLARELKISPNTVANHIKNMLEKTSSSCKTELLAKFSKKILHDYLHCKVFTKPPRILVVDDEPYLCEILQDFLQARGAKVYTETDPTKVLEKLPALHLDFIISDISMPDYSGFDMVRDIRKVFPALPIIFMITANPQYTLQQCLNEGAAALFNKPVDMDILFHSIVENYIDSDYERNRFLRVNATLPVKLNRDLELTTDNVGFGGLFISVENRREWDKLGVEVGDKIEISVSVDEIQKPIKAVAEIVWARKQSRTDLPSGVGVKFTEIETTDLDNIRDFVRSNRIRAFIPIGT